MKNTTYPFSLPPLPYAYNALEPYIDEETMRYHHDKHFETYTAGLNAAIKPYTALYNLPLKTLLAYPGRLPKEARVQILNNGGGYYNHALFFEGLAPKSKGMHRPVGALAAHINRTFGSFGAFKVAFNKAALGVFGSGWAVLAITPVNKLEIVALKNQDTMLEGPNIPLLYVDVWEHAYYLKYKNQRAAYLDNIWNVLTFPVV